MILVYDQRNTLKKEFTNFKTFFTAKYLNLINLKIIFCNIKWQNIIANWIAKHHDVYYDKIFSDTRDSKIRTII